MEDNEPARKFCASYYNHLAQEQQTILIKAANKAEAYSVALMEMGKNYTMNDIDSLYEIDDRDYHTYRESYRKYMRLYGEAPRLPDIKYDEEEQEWYIINKEGEQEYV